MAKTKAHATLTLTIEFTDDTLPDIIEASREIIEKAQETGKVEGYLDVHTSGRIFVEDLK